MRKLIVIACIATVLVVALVPSAPIAIVAVVGLLLSIAVMALRRQSPRFYVQLAVLARHSSFRAPPV